MPCRDAAFGPHCTRQNFEVPTSFFKKVASSESTDRVRIKEIGQPRKGKGWGWRGKKIAHAGI